MRNQDGAARKASWYTICGVADSDGVLEDGEVEIGWFDGPAVPQAKQLWERPCQACSPMVLHSFINRADLVQMQRLAF